MKTNLAKIGHNSINGTRINEFIAEIERLEDERSMINLSIRDTYRAAIAEGFDAFTIRKLIAERKIPEEKLEQQYSLFEAYRAAIQ